MTDVVHGGGDQMRVRLLAVVAVVIALGLTACGKSSTSSSTSTTGKGSISGAAGCMPGSGVTRTATTAKYVMVLNVGAAETMYTKDEVVANHPTSGEVMIGGQMDMGGAGSTPRSSGSAPSTTMMMGHSSPTSMAGSSGAATAHVEVHICDRATGKTATNVMPVITVVDDSMHSKPSNVPVAVMQGVGAPAYDTHYGNNVAMPTGHNYTVVVTLKGDTATFNFMR